MAAAEICNSLKMARKFALECNYESAVTFYTGIDSELATHICALKSQGKDSSKWELLRVKVADEKSSIQQLQAEIQAVVNPVAAVRLDRAAASGGVAGIIPQHYQSPPPGPTSSAGAGGFENHNNNNNNNGGHWAPPPPQERFQQHQDRYNHQFGGGGQNQQPASSPPPSNEFLYGDPLKFGPGFAPPAPQAGNNNNYYPPSSHISGNINPIPRRSSSNPSGGAQRHYTTPKSQQQQNSNNNGGGTPNTGGGAGGKALKPPVPRFGPSSNNNNNNNNNRQQQQNQKGGGVHHNDKPVRRNNATSAYQPRAGEEEIAAAISQDIFHPEDMKQILFDDIIGLHDAKQALEEAIIYPTLMPDFFKAAARKASKGVLLFGLPGTGKSLLAKAVACEAKSTFFNISPATLTSKWRGESEKAVRVLFEMARAMAPSIIFIDEIDSITGDRSGDSHEASKRSLSLLLTLIDGVGVDDTKHVVLLGATNYPENIDSAMRRRLEHRVYIPLPNYEDRIGMFKLNTREIILANDVNLAELSGRLEGQNYSGADIAILCRDAAKQQLRRFMENPANKQAMRSDPSAVSKQLQEEPVTQDDFMKALSKIPSSITAEQIRKFEEWGKMFGSGGD